MDKSRPLMPGLFRETTDGPVLIGSRCEACGRTHFPLVATCLDCLRKDLKEVDLPRRGTLFSFTTVQVRSSNFGPGHTVGYVELADGVRVFAPLVASKEQPPEVGQHVRLEISPLWRVHDDTEVIGYRFVPELPGAKGEASHA